MILLTTTALALGEQQIGSWSGSGSAARILKRKHLAVNPLDASKGSELRFWTSFFHFLVRRSVPQYQQLQSIWSLARRQSWKWWKSVKTADQSVSSLRPDISQYSPIKLCWYCLVRFIRISSQLFIFLLVFFSSVTSLRRCLIEEWNWRKDVVPGRSVLHQVRLLHQESTVR